MTVSGGNAALEMPDGTPVTLQPGLLRRVADGAATASAWLCVVGVLVLIVGGSLTAHLDKALLIVGVGAWLASAVPIWLGARHLALFGLRAALTGHGLFRLAAASMTITALAVAMLSGSMAVWAILMTGIVAYLAAERWLSGINGDCADK